MVATLSLKREACDALQLWDGCHHAVRALCTVAFVRMVPRGSVEG